MKEINLLDLYPKRKRDTKERAKNKTKEQKECALKFGWEYFDKKGICYDGYIYDGRWTPVVKRVIDYYGLKPGDKVVDVGCAKGYMLYDFLHVMPSLSLAGIDISEYAINCSPPEVRPLVQLGNAKNMYMFPDNYFDLVISITTIHSFSTIEETKQAVREIQRISKGCAYVIVDAYRNEEEKVRMEQWQLAGHFVLSAEQWKELFMEVGYTGDYYWFIP